MTFPEGTPPASPAPRPPVRRSSGRSRRGWVIGGVTALLLVGAWAGSTMYAAGQAQNVSTNLAQSVDTALKQAHIGRVERHVYARGLTSSTDDLYVVLDDKTDPVRLHLRNHIQNGPLPGLSRVAQAVVDTEIIWDDAQVQAAVDKAFGGQKPQLRTIIGLGGSTDTTLRVPAGQVQQDGDTASWQALSGQFQASSGGRAVTGTLSWPGMTAGSAKDGTATLKDIRFVVNQRPYLNKLSQGTSTFSIASITLPQGAGRLDNLQLNTTTAPTGSTLDSRTVLTAASLNVAGQTFSRLKAQLSAAHLDSAALEQLSAAVQGPEYQAFVKSSQGGSEVSDAEMNKLLAVLRPGLQKLLNGNPVLKVDEISAQLPQGRVNVALGAAVVNGAGIDLNTLLNTDALNKAGPVAALSLLSNLKLTADIEGPQDLIQGLLGASGNSTAAGLGESLAPMIEQGMIVKTGTQLKTHLEFGKNGASINGKPIPLQ